MTPVAGIKSNMKTILIGDMDRDRHLEISPTLDQVLINTKRFCDVHLFINVNQALCGCLTAPTLSPIFGVLFCQAGLQQLAECLAAVGIMRKVSFRSNDELPVCEPNRELTTSPTIAKTVPTELLPTKCRVDSRFDKCLARFCLQLKNSLLQI